MIFHNFVEERCYIEHYHTLNSHKGELDVSAPSCQVNNTYQISIQR